MGCPPAADLGGVSHAPSPLETHGAWEYDPRIRRARWSEALYRIHGVDPVAFEPTLESILELIHPADRGELTRAIEHALATGCPFGARYRVPARGGPARAVRVRGDLIESADGRRLIGTAEDASGRPEYEERLWHLANEDSLTGLFNRRRFLEELEREVAVARRTGAPGAVLMLDLDGFKGVNDSLGHAAGDTLLKRVAAALRSRLRVTDTLGRLGGDEFAAVLPDCSADQARAVSEELVSAIGAAARLRFTAGGPTRVTASVGLAEFGRCDGETGDSVLAEADRAMYAAKGRGGDRVEVFAPGMSSLAEPGLTDGAITIARSAA